MHSCRIEWDLGGWLGLSLRHLLFVVPVLAIAISQARLSPLSGSTARVTATSAVVAAWGSLHPDALSTAVGSMRPWVRLSAVEALAALMVGAGCASLLNGLLNASLQLLRWGLARHWVRLGAHLARAAPLVLLAASFLHPALPANLGCLCMAAHAAAARQQAALATGSTGANKGVHPGAVAAGWPEAGLKWLSFYSQLALLPAVGLCGWLVSGMPRHDAWSEGWALALACGLHACWLTCRYAGADNGAGSEEQQSWHRTLAPAAVHEAAACLTACASLWGHPHVAMYAAAASAAADLVLGEGRRDGEVAPSSVLHHHE